MKVALDKFSCQILESNGSLNQKGVILVENEYMEYDYHPILSSKSELCIEWCARTGSVRAKKRGELRWKETPQGRVTSAKYALMHGVSLLNGHVIRN
jgi:hypothetical protein